MTERILLPSIVGRLPDPPSGMFDVSYGVTATGMLSILRADCDIHTERRNQMWDFRPRFAQGVRASLSTFDGSSEGPAAEFRLEGPYVIADQLPDRRWIVAYRRCSPDEENAWLLSTKGELVRRFSLGDAIAHLQCDASGAIWVGFFDEASEPYGLIKVDDFGRTIWPSGMGDSYAIDIVDCYALNVAGDTAWTCYYLDFPIVKVDAIGRANFWQGSPAGVRALAVDRDFALLAGGYGGERNRLVLVDLSGDTARIVEQCRLDTFESAQPGAQLFQARNQTLHIVQQGVWRSISVADVVGGWPPE